MITGISDALSRRISLPAAMLVLMMTSAASAQQRFHTTDQAVNALVGAVRISNRGDMLTILGREAIEIVSSGDDAADAAQRQRFVAAYDAKHNIQMDGDSRAIVIVGQEDFPFPIPLVQKNGMWQFDTAAGKQEILYRRIGRNELDTIQVCLAVVDAQNDYADKDRTGAGRGIYAQRIVSQPGKRDGLYWPASGADDESPLGELFAQASQEGYSVGVNRAPFHGYYYKLLTKQGSNAPGGALDYVVSGKMIGGFALVAFPAYYGNTGVMTFLVNHAGRVYEKDLGERGGRITSFNPDQTWKLVATTAPPQ
jgi:Protein of unknown function (DUF2950)